MCILDSTGPSPPGLVWPLDTVDKRARSKLPEPPGTHTPCKGHPPTSPPPTWNGKKMTSLSECGDSEDSLLIEN